MRVISAKQQRNLKNMRQIFQSRINGDQVCFAGLRKPIFFYIRPRGCSESYQSPEEAHRIDRELQEPNMLGYLICRSMRGDIRN